MHYRDHVVFTGVSTVRREELELKYSLSSHEEAAGRAL